MRVTTQPRRSLVRQETLPDLRQKEGCRPEKVVLRHCVQGSAKRVLHVFGHRAYGKKLRRSPIQTLRRPKLWKTIVSKEIRDRRDAQSWCRPNHAMCWE